MSILTFAKKYIAGKGQEKKAGAEGKERAKRVSKSAKPARIRKAMRSGQTDINLIPLVTEKGVVRQENNYVVFRTDKAVTKGQVKEAVQAQFNTKVLGVKSVTIRPKVRRRGVTVGKTSGGKKFYVKVADIQKVVTGP